MTLGRAISLADMAPGLRRVTVRAAFAFVAVAVVFVAIHYLRVIEGGGLRWATGDWLIHYRSGLVRRGLTGTVALAISDWTGAGPLAVVGAMQVCIWLAMSGLVIFVFARTPMSGPVLMLLMSPMFLQFPFLYSGNAMMKEIIGFLGIAMLAAFSVIANRGLLLAGAAVFGLSAFANEANAFMAPAALAFIWVYRRRQTISGSLALAAGLAILGLSLAGVMVAVLFPGSGMSGPICEELGRYLDPQRFCDSYGGIWWLERDMTDAFAYMWRTDVASGAWPKFIVGYAAALLPFLLFRPCDEAMPDRVYLPVVLGILLYAPLFLLATDWGRWINMHVFSMTMLAVVLLREGFVEPRTRSLHPAFLLYGMIWGMPAWGAAPFTFGLVEKIYHFAGFG